MTSSHERSYEQNVTRVATRISKSELEAYEEALGNREKVRAERLFAYCVSFTYFRRQRDLGKCLDLYEKYCDEFGEEFIVMHLLSIAVKETGRRKDLVKSIELGRQALSIHPRHVGALHTLAGSLFLLAEEDGIENRASKERLQEARDLVEEALDLESDYPKFFATKAEIVSALGDHNGALREISKAIDKEDSESSDYSLRISDYLARKLKIELRKSIESVTDESRRELTAAMNEARESNLQTLTFFVAVISFVIAGINIAVKFSIQDAALLIFLLASAMLMAFSGFILLYDSKSHLPRFFRAFSVAVLILLIAFATRQIL